MIKEIIEFCKRNPCKECKFYVSINNTCQLKKCSFNNPYVTKIDRLFCEADKYKAESENKNEQDRI